MVRDAWDTPIFAVLTLEYPDLVWEQPSVALTRWGGELIRMVPTGPLTTL